MNLSPELIARPVILVVDDGELATGRISGANLEVTHQLQAAPSPIKQCARAPAVIPINNANNHNRRNTLLWGRLLSIAAPAQRS
jgi:hypothetical protein